MTETDALAGASAIFAAARAGEPLPCPIHPDVRAMVLRILGEV